ncbi:MAG: 50S ribosomal protein L1 [Candidatus Bathyarchaeia archaeon]
MSAEIKKFTAALEAIKRSRKRGFNQSVDLIVNLKDIDMKSGSKINELIELPHSIQKAIKVCVVGSGQMALDAKKEGADGVLRREDLEVLSKDKKAARKLVSQYDFFISEASLMPMVGKTLGVFLGPRGKMPTPVPPNAPLGPIIARHKKSVQVKLKDNPTIQCRVGTEDMSVDQLYENVKAVLERLKQKLERGARNIGAIYLKTTMGEPIKIELGDEK